MPHSQELSNNPVSKCRINQIPRIDSYFFKVHSNLSFHKSLGLPKGLFPVGLLVKMLIQLLPSSILAT